MTCRGRPGNPPVERRTVSGVLGAATTTTTAAAEDAVVVVIVVVVVNVVRRRAIRGLDVV